MPLTIKGRKLSFAWLKPPPAPPDGSMTLFEHLKELRYRLVVASLAIVIGTIVGFFVVSGFCAIAAFAFGMEPSAALALGAFTGFWGGPGFGGMMGFVLHESKVEAAEEAERDHPVERPGT